MNNILYRFDTTTGNMLCQLHQDSGRCRIGTVHLHSSDNIFSLDASTSSYAPGAGTQSAWGRDRRLGLRRHGFDVRSKLAGHRRRCGRCGQIEYLRWLPARDAPRQLPYLLGIRTLIAAVHPMATLEETRDGSIA